MKLGLYVMYDRVSEEYSPPFLARNDQEATRSFMSSLQNGAYSLYPQDFSLSCCGVFDSSTAEITAHPPKSVALSKRTHLEDQQFENKNVDEKVAV